MLTIELEIAQYTSTYKSILCQVEACLQGDGVYLEGPCLQLVPCASHGTVRFWSKAIVYKEQRSREMGCQVLLSDVQ
jgi:hypothetical protein